MSSPLIIIGGGARSGKDTVGSMIADAVKGVCIAQADPMKRLAEAVFSFSEETLWGPSEARNAVDPRYTVGDSFDGAKSRLFFTDRRWVQEVLPNASESEIDDATSKLVDWFHGIVTEVHAGKPLTARYVLQTLGTEWGRAFSKNLWVEYAQRTAEALNGGGFVYHRAQGLIRTGVVSEGQVVIPVAPPGCVIITDGRFPNEVAAVKTQAGITIKVENPAVKGIDWSTQVAGVKNHASETSLTDIPQHWWDHIVVNDKAKGLEALRRQVDEMVARLTHNHTYR